MRRSRLGYVGLMIIFTMAIWTIWGPQTAEDYTQNVFLIVVGVILIGIDVLRSTSQTSANSKHWRPRYQRCITCKEWYPKNLQSVEGSIHWSNDKKYCPKCATVKSK